MIEFERGEPISKQLAIVWDRPHIRAWQISANGRRCEVVREAVYDEPGSLQDAELLSALLELFRSRFEGVESVCVVLPRDRVNWQEFEVPNVPAAELPAIVQFQYSTQVAGATDHTIVDFLPPSTTVDGPLHVHAVGLPDRVVKLAGALADGLGVPLVYVGVSSLAVAELLAAAEQSAPGAIVSSRFYTESVGFQNGRVAYCSARRHEDSEHGRATAQLAEHLRLQLNLDEDDGERVLFVGPDESPFAISEKCTRVEQTQLPVRLNGEVETPWYDGGMLAAVGSVLAINSAAVDHLNFAAPRRPVPPKDYTKQYLRAAIAACALLVVGVFWKTWSDKAALDDRIEESRDKLADIKEFLDAKGELRAVRGTLDDYLTTRVPLAEIMDTVLSSMPDRRKLIVESIEPTQLTGDAVARVKGRAYGASLDDLEQFEAELDRVYQVKPQSKVPSSERPGYKFVLDFEFDVPRERETVTRRATETEAKAETTSSNAGEVEENASASTTEEANNANS